MDTVLSDELSPDPAQRYAQLLRHVGSLVRDERDAIANLANSAALMLQGLPDVNWVGYYLLKGNELVLGPFQGKPACVRIAVGRGVCGAAAERRRTVIVANVHEFSGHIACDPESNSEIVVPLLDGDRLYGVLDVDSPLIGRFSRVDADGLASIAACVIAASDMTALHGL